MRNIVRYFQLVRLLNRFFPYVEEADSPDYWTPTDANALRNFLESYSGNKLRVRLRNYAIKMALEAVKNSSNPSYQNGVATGVSMLNAAIDSHLPVGVPTDAESEPSNQAVLDELESQTA